MRILSSTLALLLLAPAAFADINAFNDKMKARDFKAAAAEATTTWAEIDKSRADIGLIAREFGFASYLAGEYEPAKTWALFAAGATPPGSDYAMAIVLLRLSELRLAPSKVSRDALAEALTARAAETGMDNISYIGAEALVGYDFQGGRWSDAETSAGLAATLSGKGGPSLLERQRRFQLFEEAAQYMRSKDKDAYFGMVDLVKTVAADIDAAASDDDANRLAPTYWEARAWALSMDSHLTLRRVALDRTSDGAVRDNLLAYPKREAVYQPRASRAACPTRLEFTRMPQYPASAAFRGFVGTVIAKVDIDDKGLASNPSLLAAIPETGFGKAVLGSVGLIRVKPGAGYDAAACSLAQTGRVIEYVFTFQ